MTKELSPRILRNVVPNPQCLNLNVNTRISTDYIESFHLPLRESSEKYIEKVGPIGAELVRKINDILGCESVSLQQYGVQVIVGDAFDPDTDGITDAVIEALKDCFGDKRDEVEVVNKDTRHFYSRSSRDDSDFHSLDDGAGFDGEPDEHGTDMEVGGEHEQVSDVPSKGASEMEGGG